MEEGIAHASKAFGALCKPVFHDGDLSLKTKRLVYCAAVLGTLLYGVLCCCFGHIAVWRGDVDQQKVCYQEDQDLS